MNSNFKLDGYHTKRNTALNLFLDRMLSIRCMSTIIVDLVLDVVMQQGVFVRILKFSQHFHNNLVTYMLFIPFS